MISVSVVLLGSNDVHAVPSAAEMEGITCDRFVSVKLPKDRSDAVKVLKDENMHELGDVDNVKIMFYECDDEGGCEKVEKLEEEKRYVVKYTKSETASGKLWFIV